MVALRGMVELVRTADVRHGAPLARFLSGTSALLSSTPRSSRGMYSVRSDRGLAPAFKVTQPSTTWIGVKYMHLDISAVPDLSDPQAKQALNALLATNWLKIDREVFDTIEAAVAKGGADASVLSTVWSSAQASEKFADTPISLRMELDKLSGADGESVGRLPEVLLRALESAHSKYPTYLEAIGDDEDFLKKKAENDLGSILVQIKQCCNGLDSKWGTGSLVLISNEAPLRLGFPPSHIATNKWHFNEKKLYKLCPVKSDSLDLQRKLIT